MKTALLTGALGGIGQSIALRFAKDNFHLILPYRNAENGLAGLEKTLQQTGGSYQFVQADLSRENDIVRMIETCGMELNGIDVLIYNAGLAYSGLSWKQSYTDWDEVLRQNLSAPWLCSRYCIPLLRKKPNSRIVYISSVVAHRPLAGTSAYASAKSGLEGLCRAQAVELSRFGITVNCVSPGYINAGMIAAISAEAKEEILAATPLQRLGNADEISSMVAYLCSEKANFITGQVLHINGGLYI